MVFRVVLWLWLGGVLAGGAWAQEAPVRATYVANEGVLLAHGGVQVLIDGLHRPYRPAYDVLPPEERERLETAQPPYDGIDVVLVSHIHRDHFHAEAVGRHLRHNPGAVLVASQQAADSLAEGLEAFAAVAQQVRAVTPAEHEADTVWVGGVAVVVLRLRHTNERFRWVQNLGFVVTLGGKRLLHLGDAAMAADAFAPFAPALAGVDVAFLPVWFLRYEDGQRIVREQLRPRRIVAVHVAPGEEETAARQVREAFPEAVVFSGLLQSITF